MEEKTDVFDSLNNLFSGGSESEKYELLGQLIDPKNIKLKTDLTPRQIRGIIKMALSIRVMKDETGIDLNYLVTDVITELELLNVSKNRKSREEIIEGLKTDEGDKTKNKIKEALGV